MLKLYWSPVGLTSLIVTAVPLSAVVLAMRCTQLGVPDGRHVLVNERLIRSERPRDWIVPIGTDPEYPGASACRGQRRRRRAHSARGLRRADPTGRRHCGPRRRRGWPRRCPDAGAWRSRCPRPTLTERATTPSRPSRVGEDIGEADECRTDVSRTSPIGYSSRMGSSTSARPVARANRVRTLGLFQSSDRSGVFAPRPPVHHRACQPGAFRLIVIPW
jgi:hypothetical protein